VKRWFQQPAKGRETKRVMDTLSAHSGQNWNVSNARGAMRSKRNTVSFFSILSIAALCLHLSPYKHMFLFMEMSPYRILLLMGTYVSFLMFCLRRRVGIRLYRTEKLLLISLSPIFASIAWSPLPYETARYLLDVVYALLFLFLVVYIRERKMDIFTYACSTYVVLAPVLVLYGFYVLAVCGGMRVTSSSNLETVSPNQLSIWCLVVSAFLLINLHQEKKRSMRVWSYIFVPLLTFLVLISGSRSGFLTLIVMMTIVGVSYALRKMSMLRILLYILAFLCVIGSLTYMYSDQLSTSFERVKTRMKVFQFSDGNMVQVRLDEENIGKGRYMMYLFFYEEVLRGHWLFGISYGVFRSKMEAIYGVAAKIPHNLLLRLWAGGGIAAVILFLWFFSCMTSTWWKAVRHYRRIGLHQRSTYLNAFMLGAVLILFYGIYNPVIDNPLLYFNIALFSDLAEG